MSELQAAVPKEADTKAAEGVEKSNKEEATTLSTEARNELIEGQDEPETGSIQNYVSQPEVSVTTDVPTQVQEIAHTLHPNIGNTDVGEAQDKQEDQKEPSTTEGETQAADSVGEANPSSSADAAPSLRSEEQPKGTNEQIDPQTAMQQDEAEEGEIEVAPKVFKTEEEQTYFPRPTGQDLSKEEPEEGEFEEHNAPSIPQQVDVNNHNSLEYSNATVSAAENDANITHAKPEPGQDDVQALPPNGNVASESEVDLAPSQSKQIVEDAVDKADIKEVFDKGPEPAVSAEEDYQVETHAREAEDVEMRETDPQMTHKDIDPTEPTSSVNSAHASNAAETQKTTIEIPSSPKAEKLSLQIADASVNNHISDVPVKASIDETSTPAPIVHNESAIAQENSSTATSKPRTTRRMTPETIISATSTGNNNAGSTARTVATNRQDEATRIRRETEDMRLLWLSLPSHDHPSYYSDTDEENASSSSSCAADAILPRNASGREPYLSLDHLGESSIRQKQRQDDWVHDLDDDLSDVDGDGLDLNRAITKEEKMYRIGNRGNKLKKGSRWVRNGKLGTSTDARNEKDITERFTERLKALQRTQVDSMLQNAQGPPLSKKEPDILEGSDRLLLRDIHKPPAVSETSTLLAPQLLRPILSTRALLQSHTLRHTFRNPHIGALSRTALDLRESESQLSRSLSRCLGAMEARPSKDHQVALTNGDVPHSNGALPGSTDGIMHKSNEKQDQIDLHAVGVEGTQGTEDEMNPAFAQLDRLFVTKEGLPIPLGGQVGEDGQIEPSEQRGVDGNEGAASQTILSADQQRDVIRAALECLHELDGDSLEYVERLEEVRSRLAAVKQKRLQVWNALRIWALKREGDDIETDSSSKIANANDAIAEVTNATTSSTTRGTGAGSGGGQGKTTSTGNTGSTKRRRVAA